MSPRNRIAGAPRCTAAGLVATLLLAGCGGGGDDAGSSGSTQADSSKPGAEAPQSGEGGKKASRKPKTPKGLPAEGSPQRGRAFTRSDARTYLRKRLTLRRGGSPKPKRRTTLKLGTCSGGPSVWTCRYTVHQASVTCRDSARVGYVNGRFRTIYKARCKGQHASGRNRRAPDRPKKQP